MSAQNKVHLLKQPDTEALSNADQARLEAAEAGWQTTIEALNLVLAAADEAGAPEQVALDTVALAKSRIDSAIAMMERVEDLSEKLEFTASSSHQH